MYTFHIFPNDVNATTTTTAPGTGGIAWTKVPLPSDMGDTPVAACCIGPWGSCLCKPHMPSIAVYGGHSTT